MKKMNVKETLRKFNINDFSELKKEQYGTFISSMPHMEPEVCKLALEHVPEFVSFSKILLENTSREFERGMNSNDLSVRNAYAAHMNTLITLNNMLEKRNLSFQEKQNIIDKIIEILKMMNEIDARNKNFITITLLSVLGFGVILVVIFASLLGIKIKIPWNSFGNFA